MAEPRKLLDQVRDSVRARHYSIRTEEAYFHVLRVGRSGSAGDVRRSDRIGVRTQVTSRHIDLERFPAALECASSPEWSRGLWDEESYVWLLEPTERYELLSEEDFLQVGRPGVDGIAFRFRASSDGFWAFHPIDRRFQLLAPSVAEFVQVWYAGVISV